MKKHYKYPQYYEVNDIPVILILEGKEVLGMCANGTPYPIGKAFVDGHQITKDEYLKLAISLYNVRPFGENL